MAHDASLDQTPRDTLKLLRLLDVLSIVLVLACVALVWWGEAPRLILNGAFVAFFCLVLARIVIERRSGVPRLPTGASTAGFLIIAAGSAVAAMWFFPALQTNLLLLGVIPLTRGVGEFFRWRARSQNA